MRKFLFSILLAAPALAAQSLITVGPQQCVWRAGDNPAWAAPALDESGWQSLSTWKIDLHTPRIWVRCHANLAPLAAVAQPALQTNLDAAYQVYVDGSLAGSTGNLSSAQYDMSSCYTVPLARASLETSAVLALRAAFRMHGQSPPPQIQAGDRHLLDDHRAAVAVAGVLDYLPIGLCYALLGVVGFMLLGLYLTDRGRTELLLLAVICWQLCTLRLLEFCEHALVPMSSVLFCALYGAGQCLEFFWVALVFRLAGKRVPWFYRIAIALSLSEPIWLFLNTILPQALNLRQDDLYFRLFPFLLLAGLACISAPLAAFWPWNRIAPHRRTVAWLCATWSAVDSLWFLLWEAAYYSLISDTHIAIAMKYLLIVRVATTMLCVLALLTIFFHDQRRVAQERAELHGEMASAREIQQYLIPEKLPPTPGLVIRSVYQPAREVGGDFFQVLPDPRDGSTLLIVGDVAGKGLQAGMLAALIVGAVRTAFQFTSDPSRILALLNDRLQGRGLVTCLALRIDHSGQSEIANAGHPAPYINGKELPLDGALPLGALPSVNFPTSRFQLREGESVLFVSDGVLEARNESGELFGFERTAQLSSQTAEQIAQTAQAFGQEDDITVLTLCWQPAEPEPDASGSGPK